MGSVASVGSTGSRGKGRADMDTNWRNHEEQSSTSLPPSGSKGKNKNKVKQKSEDKGKCLETDTKQRISAKPDAKAVEETKTKSSTLKLDNDRLKPQTETKTKVDSERLKADPTKESNKPVEVSTRGKRPDVSRLNAVVAAQLEKAKKVESAVRAAKGDQACRTGMIDNVIKDNNNKLDENGFQLVESENNVRKRKKQKKKKSERDKAKAASVQTASNGLDNKSDSKVSDTIKVGANSSTKPNAGNRFSRVAGPQIPKR